MNIITFNNKNNNNNNFIDDKVISEAYPPNTI